MANGKIFISYRREDTSGESGRLKDKLEQVFGQENIFYDVETLEAGLNFDQSIAKALGESKVLLAMIGPHWLKVADSKGVLRLQKEDDWVRKEIAEALRRELRVIPILVNGAEMPGREDLPSDLKELSLKHAQELSSSRWNYDVGELTKVLEKIIAKKPEPKPQPKPNPAPFPTPDPQPKSWLVKNYLWILGGVVAFSVLIAMCSDPDTDTYPIEDTNTLSAETPTDGSGAATNPASPPDLQESDTQTGEDYDFDLAGEWSLYLNGQKVSVFAFSQNGASVAYYEYDLLNQRTGEGKGLLDGEFLEMDYYSTATAVSGTISMSTQNSGQSWAGTIYFPASGVSAQVELAKY
ncbi:toll/interleukin-1 receptor domain-containing protein [Algoriphagus sp. H41]|uniref:Toll/interleukin-1 receptor domain-containing protein n=1 Tax=Algoriphagus oliviformis TaxID=2811231 RepID=A0ABS3C6K2_9BACT|nr:toll/interleukin-1 receptor domain-containing protein [Algoriphagus oliviformis]MBN7812742.1 toll/interleukin-1 receptor domain-containing protein [Algoriphagus oliviformis]